jgi:CheY-like chemotaxis protein
MSRTTSGIPGSSHSAQRVLLIAQGEEMRLAVGEALLASGYRVAFARDSQDALTRLECGLRPCLIVVDLDATRPDVTLLRDRLAADARLACIPLVARADTEGGRESARDAELPLFPRSPAAAVLRAFIERHGIAS